MNMQFSAEARSLLALPKGIERHAIRDRASWLEMRKRDITASVIGCLLGVHEFTTARKQWALHVGIDEPDREQTAAMERGELLEPVAAELLRRRQPNWLISYPVGFYYRDPAARIGATPDILAVDPSRPGFGIVQTKSVEASIYRKKWRRDEGGEWIVEPPLWIVIQAIVEASLTGASWAAVAPLVVGHGLDMPLIDIPIRADIMGTLRGKVREFWDMVATGAQPDADYSKDGDLIALLHGGGDGTTIDLSHDNMLPAILDEDERLKDEISAAETRRKAIKAEIVSKLGNATFATVSGWTVACKSQTRKSFVVKESTFPVLRTKRTQEKTYASG